MKLFTFIALLFIVATCFTLSRAEEEEAKGVTEVKPVKKVAGGDKWKNIKIEDIEKEWEQGDDTETENDRLEKLRAARRPDYDINDPASLKRAYKKDPSTFGSGGQNPAGTALVFVDIYKRKPKPGKEDYTENEVAMLAKKWTSLLSSGSVLTQMYNPAKNQILINIDRGWQTKEVMRFVANQKEVKHLTLNNKKFTPKEYLAEADEDEEDL